MLHKGYSSPRKAIVIYVALRIRIYSQNKKILIKRMLMTKEKKSHDQNNVIK